MKVTKEDLQNVAVLSRLSIAEDQEDKYIGQLDKFLTYVENLSGVNTEGVKPTTYALPMQNVFREDTVKESRELAEVFRTIADIIEQKILPADWRCADAESEENDAQPDGNPA